MPDFNTANDEMPKSRHMGIDGLRFLLCFAVALIHTLPNSEGHSSFSLSQIVTIACRSAVPFFFIASGYFIKIPNTWNPTIFVKPLSRLLPVYIAWFLIYGAIFGSSINSIHAITTGGTAFHLWFIPALGFSLAVVPTAILFFGKRLAWLLVITIAMTGLIFGAYSGVLGLHGRGGIRLTMGPALVMIGHCFARRGSQLSTPLAGLGVIISVLAMIAEEWLIGHLSGQPFISHDIVLSTYVLGSFIFLLGLSNFSFHIVQALAPLGRISLGVYASHLIFIRLIESWTASSSVGAAAAIATGAVIMATMSALILNKVPFARSLVR